MPRYRYFYFAVFLCLLFHNALLAGGNQGWESKPFETDPEALYKAASQATTAGGSDATVLLDEERYSFDATGRTIHTKYLVYKVLTQQGAEDWADISENWEPWHEERPEIKARVITPDFAVHMLDSKTITDGPAQDEDNNIYSDRRVSRAPLPAIAPGSVVEEQQITRENTVMFHAGMVARTYVGRTVPTQHARVILDAPTSLPLHFAVRSLPGIQPERTEKDGRVQIVFDAGPLDPLQTEEHELPSDVAAYPEIVFSTGASWQLMAAEYSKIVDSKIANADVKPLVAKLTADKQSREEKAGAILRYLDREVRYTGVEFGDAAIVPQLPSETLKQKYGDCKDKATLLVAMLRAAGIPANVALLNAGEREDVTADLPGMGLFDHAIVYVPGTPELWIDATDEYARLGELPADDQGRLALIAADDSQALVQTPISASQDNALIEQREFYLMENGPARVVEISEPHGSLESEYRGYYADKENKERKTRLTDYVKSQYLADKLDSFTRSDPADISSQFQLRLESNKAKRGYTELDTAGLYIRLDSLFGRLPNELQSREKDEKNEEDKDAQVTSKPHRKRTADYQLETAFVTEWHYTVVPPPGFLAKPLPENTTLSAGPATLSEEFSTDKDGVVHAVLRFDTVKRRFTVAEAEAMRNQITQWRDGQPISISFEPVAQKLLREGKVRESLQAYRDLIALHPKESLHHVQMAETLLKAGLGEGARQEARIAVKLEPSSALAQEMLADVLEHDLVGRNLRPGSDLASAEAAMRAAIKLDPDNKALVGDLAVLLEYNRDADRYGTGAKLTESIAEYRTLKPEQLEEIGRKNNLPYTLMYAGEFAEAQKSAEALNPPPNIILIAAETALKGSQAGIAVANEKIASESERKEAMKGAGQILMRLRKYSQAADLFDAGANGDNASQSVALASMLRKTHPREDLHYGDDPVGVVMQQFVLLFENRFTMENMDHLWSRNAQKVNKNTEQDEIEKALKSGHTLHSMFLRSAVPVDAIIDMSLEHIDVKSEGDDASGYKVTTRSPGEKQATEFVVKEDGHYKILDGSQKPNAIGLEILDRIAANNPAGARILLDWIREEQHLAGGDDPLAGQAFPRFWTKGKDASLQQMTLAAAAILVQTRPTAAQGVAILEDALPKATDDTAKLNILLALITGYSNLKQYEKLLNLAVELGKQYPESRTAFLWQTIALRTLGRYDEADKLAQNRLASMSNDRDAMLALMEDAVAKEDYAQAYALNQKIIDAGKSEAVELNRQAWLSLYTGKTNSIDLETAIKATQQSQNNASYLHTLGCVYAELGKTKEAREVLIQAMDILHLDEPDDDYWYAFGRIAEQYGERELAMADYKRVEKPKNARNIPESTYSLAQQRLKILHDSSITPSKNGQGR